MEFLKSIGGKIVTGLVALAVIVSAISWWSLDEGTRREMLHGAGRIAAWFGVVLVVPWATFFLIGRVGRLESNVAGGLLVLAYTIVEAVLLAWLFGWAVKGATPIVFFVAAALSAGVYNLFACDWIAEKVQ